MLKFHGHGIAAAAIVVVAVISISCGPGSSRRAQRDAHASASPFDHRHGASGDPGDACAGHLLHRRAARLAPCKQPDASPSPPGWSRQPSCQRSRPESDLGSGWSTRTPRLAAFGALATARPRLRETSASGAGPDVDARNDRRSARRRAGQSRPGADVSTPTDVSVSGFDAQRIELSTLDQEGARCAMAETSTTGPIRRPTGDVSRPLGEAATRQMWCTQWTWPAIGSCHRRRPRLRTRRLRISPNWTRLSSSIQIEP